MPPSPISRSQTVLNSCDLLWLQSPELAERFVHFESGDWEWLVIWFLHDQSGPGRHGCGPPCSTRSTPESLESLVQTCPPYGDNSITTNHPLVLTRPSSTSGVLRSRHPQTGLRLSNARLCIIFSLSQPSDHCRANPIAKHIDGCAAAIKKPVDGQDQTNALKRQTYSLQNNDHGD